MSSKHNNYLLPLIKMNSQSGTDHIASCTAFERPSPTENVLDTTNRAGTANFPLSTTHSKARLLFLSSCPEAWGGSEELWAGAARQLVHDGHHVSACKTFVVFDHPRIQELEDAGILVEDYYQFSVPRLQRYLHSLLPRRFHFLPTGVDECLLVFTRRLRSLSTDLAVISQGENFDGLQYCNACQKAGVPYVLICQKASDLNWPPDCIRTVMQRAFCDAERVYFVSEHNRNLTERQIACRLTNAEVVRNPFLTNVDAPLPYPNTSPDRFRLACVARLFVLEKGQDTLLEVLALDKWRHRNLEVNFYGQGIHREALECARDMLGLANVYFRGFTNDITEVWRQHHALILPSRAEGLPLALVEAMRCGRLGIVTNVGGNAEVIDDEETGFLARGMDAASLDEVLERAWHRRHQWEQIGLEAARRIREIVLPDPCGEFATKLIAVWKECARGKP